ncbi:MAG TPA: sigma factor, partial [Ktedonobacteraceae bacterium]
MISSERSQFPERAAEDEAEMIRRAQLEPALFAELYQRHLGRIYAYLRARVSCDEDAADLAQQVFLQAFDALPKYQV